MPESKIEEIKFSEQPIKYAGAKMFIANREQEKLNREKQRHLRRIAKIDKMIDVCIEEFENYDELASLLQTKERIDKRIKELKDELIKEGK